MIELAIPFLDVVLVLAGFWMLSVVRKSALGGTMGRTLYFITAGVILLGFAHLLETLLFEYVGLTIEMTELTHRLVVLAGFILLTFGLSPYAELNNQ